MKNKKGFTLIELLAVIVVLAVIMVIAVPKILDVITKSRESAAESSIKLVKDAIRSQITTASMSGVTFEKVGGCYIFDFDNKEAELELETRNIDDYLDEFDFKNNMEVDSLEKTLNMPPISADIKKNDEFLKALKEFRKNLE